MRKLRKSGAGLRKQISIMLLAVICIVSMSYTPVYAEGDVASTENVNSGTVVSPDLTPGEDAPLDGDAPLDEDVPSEEPLKVLFIGNSFSKNKSNVSCNVAAILNQLAKISGKQLEATTLCHNAAHLSYYAFLSETYKSYYQEASDALMNSQWDYIVLQDFSKNGIQCAENEMFPAIRQLNNMITKYQKSAKVLLYATHGYQNGTSTVVNGKSTVLTTQQMQAGVAAAYDRIGKELGITVVPVGMIFWHCNKVYPSIQLYSEDLKHPSYAGYYLAACTFYYQIFQELPKGEADSLSGSDLSELTLRCLESLVDDRAGISAKEAAVAIGGSLQLSAATILDSGYLGGNNTWQSMDEGIASVNASTGTVTGVAEGTTQIMVETGSGLQDFCTVHVVEDSAAQYSNTNMSFGQASYTVTYGDVIRILPAGYFSTAQDNLTWTSSNQLVGIISADGTVTTIKPGRTIITVKRKDSAAIKARYTLYVACTAPRQVTASLKSCVSSSSAAGKITVKWSQSYGASSYIVYRSSTKNGTYKKIASVKTNSYTDGSAVKNQYYYYKIAAKATYTNTMSLKSSCSNAMMAPASPKNLKAASAKKTIKITWTKNSKANGYIVYRSTKKNSGYKRVKTITNKATVTYTDRTAQKGKPYYYRVKVYKKMSGKYYYSASSQTSKAKLS